MDLLWLINRIRYMKPVETITSLLPVTLILSLMTYVVDLFVDMFYTDIELIALLMFAVIADLASGIWANKLRKNPLTSLGLRQTIIKIIEYAIFLLVLTGIANVFGQYDIESSSFILKNVAAFMKDINVIGFLLLIWTELISISENMFDKDGGIKRVLDYIRRKLKENKIEK